MTKYLGTKFNDYVNIQELPGNDTIFTFAGDDQVYSYDGRDFVSTGPGSDRATVLSGTILGGPGGDSLSLSAEGTIKGGGGDDYITSSGEDYYDSHDTVLIGGPGDDTVQPGAGNDICTGGSGADTFFFYIGLSGRPIVTDFEHGTDTFLVLGNYYDLSFDNIYMKDLGPATFVGWHIDSTFDSNGFIVLGNEPITESDFVF